MISIKLPAALQLSIRSKLLLASMVLLIIPIIGFQYVKELEAFLREDQEQRLLDNARTISTVLGSQPKLETAFKVSNITPPTEHIYVRPLAAPILLDGFHDDWQFDQTDDKIPRLFRFTDNNANTDPLPEDPPAFEFLTGHRNRNMYVFFKVTDKKLVYQNNKADSILDCDYILIKIGHNDGSTSQFIISTYSPGAIQAKEIIKWRKHEIQYKLFPRIKAVWQETARGYNVELRLPQSILGEQIAFAVVDIDDAKQVDRRYTLSAAMQNSEQQLSSLTVPRPELDHILAQFSKPQSRTWLINAAKNVIAVSGTIYADSATATEFENTDISLSAPQFIEGLMRLIYQSILPQPDVRFPDDIHAASTLTGSDIEQALSGTAATQWRLTKNSNVNILRAVYPIYSGKNIIGAVAVEKNNSSILLLQNRAVEILMNTSIIVFLLSAMILISFASHLSFRIRRLRDETEKAISEDGRIHADKIAQDMLSSTSGDEIGDLQRSYADMLVRLADYNRYLEGMAGKLSHELRTPVTVVKSSLENLETDLRGDTNSTYLERAKDGVNRLNDILTRMSEATRLEQTLKAEEKHPIDIKKIAAGCVEGYKIAHGEQRIHFNVWPKDTGEDIYILGCAELIAQMLDKLVSNALDFCDDQNPVRVTLTQQETDITLSVINTGSSLPEEMQSNLFESMVSVREKRSDQPHLGLGLYIVRLIAEFHAGNPFAHNVIVSEDFDPDKTQRLTRASMPEQDKDDNRGVEVGVKFKRYEKTEAAPDNDTENENSS